MNRIRDGLQTMQKVYGTTWLDELNSEWEAENEKVNLDVENWKDFEKNSLKIFHDDDLCEFYARWIELRANYYYAVRNYKFKNLSERYAYQDFHSMNLGGPDWACKTCGLILYDNFQNTEALYGTLNDFYRGNCSIECEKNEKLNCVVCEMEYKPFEAKKLAKDVNRVGYSGICSIECLEVIREVNSRVQRDKKYIYQIKRRVGFFGLKSEVDDKVTSDEVYNRDNGICYICGNLTFQDWINRPLNQRATVDHVIPISKGGSHTWQNVRIACWRCNITKHDRIL